MVSTNVLDKIVGSTSEIKAESNWRSTNSNNNVQNGEKAVAVPNNVIIPSTGFKRNKPKTRSIKSQVSASTHSSTDSPGESIVQPSDACVVGPYAQTRKYGETLVPTIGAFARASTGHVGPTHARAKGPTAEAGAHASLLGVGAFANAEVGRLETTVGGVTTGIGLNFNTGASIGVDGVSVSALGFGVSVGPRNCSVRTPVADMSCSIL